MDAINKILSAGEHIVNVTEDAMEATINLVPPADGKMFAKEDIIEILKQNGVVQGIKEEAIERAIKDLIFYENIFVAEGKEPVDGEPGFYTYNFRTKMPIVPKALADGSVDYKNMELFETVDKGKIIAEYTPPTNGIFGYTVKGKLIAPRRGRELPMLRGHGFILSEDKKTYTAAISGKITLTGMRLEISQLFVVDGSLSLATGNVDFDGNVYIKGSVPAGYEVRAGGDITIDGNVEAASIEVGGNVLLRAGMQGAGTGRIKAGGWISGKFFESVNIQAEGYVQASYLLSCDVETHDIVKVEGKKGKIIGGTIRAVRGVNVYTAGNVAQVKTIFVVGVSDSMLASYQSLCQQIEKSQSEIKIFKDALMKYQTAKQKQQVMSEEMFSKIVQAKNIREDELKELSSQRDVFVATLSTKERSKVIVKGVAYPGTVVIIDTERLAVSTEVKNVSFVRRGDRVAVYANI